MRITDFSHIVPVSKIDITVGTRAPKVAEVDRTTTVPRTADIRPRGMGLAVEPPREGPFPSVAPHLGFRLDVFA
ncbi:MAG TPA: hypothetical protein QGF95_27420 [Candidatus Latescibacteria bacterium]|nr:hypothetical protein [Gemmatimonadaceae bacterium]MDP6015928.1 hypothetical protein [Candidatus Latescibacterota bacterium]HJP34294.1 hypothetical protein [Candidatus Latescibacterota bacterium]